MPNLSLDESQDTTGASRLTTDRRARLRNSGQRQQFANSLAVFRDTAEAPRPRSYGVSLNSSTTAAGVVTEPSCRQPYVSLLGVNSGASVNPTRPLPNRRITSSSKRITLTGALSSPRSSSISRAYTLSNSSAAPARWIEESYELPRKCSSIARSRKSTAIENFGVDVTAIVGPNV